MTQKQAKSELEAIYMSLSEEKKQALDVAFKAMEQAQNCDQCEVGNPCLYCKHEFMAQADRNEFYNWDAPIRHKADGEKTCGTCRNEDTYHCAECENKSDYEQAQADGEYISRQDAISKIREMAKWHTGDAFNADRVIQHLKQLPSVAIPNKVGHWEYNQYDGNPNIGNWHCSECRNIVSDMPTCMGKPLYEFCPNCGCPMEIER